MKNINWNEVPDQVEFDRLTPGGYVCEMKCVVDVPAKEYLKIEYDIAEGTHKGYYQELYKSKSFWGGTFYRSYKEKALPMFKGFLTAVKESNPGFVFENQEKRMEGKLVGLVLAEEEYMGNDGKVKKRLYVSAVRSVEKIRKGDFNVPELKKYNPAGSRDGFYPVDDSLSDDDVPF